MVTAVMIVAVVAGSAHAKDPWGVYVGLGDELFRFSDTEYSDRMEWDSPLFIGFNAEAGFRFHPIVAASIGVEYYLPKKGMFDIKYTLTTLQTAVNVYPFPFPGIKGLYFTGGVDLVFSKWESESIRTDESGNVLGKFSYSEKQEDVEFVAGIGYELIFPIGLSIFGETTYITGDRGGSELEVGLKYYFMR